MMLTSILGFDPFGFDRNPLFVVPARKPIPEPVVIDDEDPVQSLAYDPERWPHCMDIEAANGPA